MCIKLCVCIFLTLFSISALIVGGYVGKYYWLRQDMDKEEVTKWWVDHSGEFFVPNGTFWVWGLFSVGIVLIAALLLKLLSWIFCNVLKLPWTTLKYGYSVVRSKSRKKEEGLQKKGEEGSQKKSKERSFRTGRKKNYM